VAIAMHCNLRSPRTSKDAIGTIN